MNLIAVVLARAGSKGIPNKHTRLLCGKPVIQYTLDILNESRHIAEYLVSSDSEEILELARQAGGIPIWRPPFLAQDNTPTLPALQHAVMTFEQLLGWKAEYVVEVRATSPLKTVGDVDGAIDLLVSSGVESVIGVCELGDRHPARAKYLNEQGYLRDFLPEPVSGRRQDLQPTAYIRNGSIYAFRRDAVLGEQAKLFGHEWSLPYVMPPERSINLDTPLDLEFAEFLMRKREAP